MKQIETVKASKLLEVFEHIEEIRQKRVDREIWYRGLSSQNYKLSPGLHRTKEEMPVVTSREGRLYKEFHFRSPMYDTLLRTDIWDQLFLMQHYRLPTRLLDWTSSPLIGLFFALSTFQSNKGAKGPALWVLDPARWNAGMLSDISGADTIYPTDDPIIDQYHPMNSGGSKRSEPLAIEGVINNPRISAQRGKFIIFGQQKKPLEQYCNDYKGWAGDVPLMRIDIDPLSAPKMFYDLQQYGVTHSSVYPDLEGLAVEIKAKYGY